MDGSAEYICNLHLPGMLYGKIHRSSIAHGRIAAYPEIIEAVKRAAELLLGSASDREGL